MQVRALEAALAATVEAFLALGHGADVEVSTVDGYQGREADAVVFSFTRNNEKKALGFVQDPRRLNVAITRPRRALVVLGAPNMLRRDDNWGRCGGSSRSLRCDTSAPPAAATRFVSCLNLNLNGACAGAAQRRGPLRCGVGFI